MSVRRRAMRLLVATTNPDKLREIRDAARRTSPVELLSLRDLPADRRARGNRRDVRGERAAQGALLRRACATGARAGGSHGRRGFGAGHRCARRRAGRPLGAVPAAGRDLPGAVRRDLPPACRSVPDAPRTARFVCALAVVTRRRACVFETTGTVEGEIADGAARHRRLRVRPDLLLPAVSAARWPR